MNFGLKWPMDMPERYMYQYSICGEAAAPMSKASSAPTTCMEYLRLIAVCYAPMEYQARFFKVPGEDRHLTRGQIELAAAKFSGSKNCNF